jgi:NADH-quinone oxidoreductase subunit J
VTLNLFYFLSFLGILSALLVVFSKNPVHSVLYLIITFFVIAAHYVLLNAQFLAIVHVIVYAGAIMVLFLYVIMLLNLNQEAEPHKSNLIRFAATISAGLLLLVLVGTLKGTDQMLVQSAAPVEVGLVKSLGRVLFKEYMLPFEISSILLLAAMVGAVMLGKPENIKK